MRNANERELPFLAGIAGVLRWFEELASIISGPLLTFGLGVALVDLLTDGKLLASQPTLLYAWAVSQAVGVDAQLVGAWDKARQALRFRRYWSLVGLLILGIALAYVGYLAAIVFAIQQSAGITTAQALAELGLDSGTWLVSRAALSVVLVCLSGWTRYHPPAQSSVEEEATKLQRELALEPLRVQVRMRKALGWRDVGRSILQGDASSIPVAASMALQEGASIGESPETTREPSSAPGGVQRDAGGDIDASPKGSDEPPSKPPTGPGSPARARRRASKRRTGLGKRPRLVRVDTAEQRIRALLAEDSKLSIRQLAKRAHTSESTASKWARVIRGEADRSERAAQ